MSKEKRRVPKLRFPGFTEDWEQRKLGDVANIKTGSRNQQDSVTNGKYPFFIRSEKIEKLDTYDFDTEAILVPGDGRIGEIFHYYNGKFALHQRVYKVDDFKGVDAFYLLYLFQCKFKEHALRLNAQGTVPSLRLPMFTEWNISMPSLPEQICIERLLNKIELMITLHQRKLEHLNLKKKALLQKLFPKNGERYPELRFPGFTDAWEQRKLGDFTNQINTFVNPEDAKLPLWSLTAEAGLIEKSDRYERDFLVKKKDQFKRIETNTLVYNPMNITIGSIDIYTGLYPIAVSGYYVSIVYDKNIDTDFLKEALLLPSSLKMYKNYATGSLIERQRVQYPTFSKLQLLLPNLDEQKAIGQLFKSLNLNITLHQRKLEHLQLQKKALLQQMFV